MPVAFVLLAASMAFAQEEAPPVGPLANSNPVTLATEFFENNNYFNYFAIANAVYDSYNPTINSEGKSINNGGAGFQIGGGVGLRHVWQKATLSINYTGDYRDYSSNFFSSGTDQNLGLAYSRRLARHLTLNLGVGGGTILYGTGYFGQQQVGTGNIQLNPFSNSTRFLSSYISLSYQQTRRLSYNVSGAYYLQRYSYPAAVGSTGGSGDIGVNYRITSRTTISADYGRSYFVFQHNAGTSTVDNYYATVSHRFVNHWTVAVSGGVSRSHVTGITAIPVTFLTNTGLSLNGYVLGPYNTVALLPSFSGSVTHFLKRSSFSAGGGQNIVSGNGYYLASKNQYLYGVYSKSFYKSNVSFGGNWNKLNSVANTVAYSYVTTGLSANYSRALIRHVGVNFRYDYIRYGAVANVAAVADHRFSAGFNFSSQSIPLALY